MSAVLSTVKVSFTTNNAILVSNASKFGNLFDPSTYFGYFRRKVTGVIDFF